MLSTAHGISTFREIPKRHGSAIEFVARTALRVSIMTAEFLLFGAGTLSGKGNLTYYLYRLKKRKAAIAALGLVCCLNLTHTKRSEQDGKKQRGCGAVRVKSCLVL